MENNEPELPIRQPLYYGVSPKLTQNNPPYRPQIILASSYARGSFFIRPEQEKYVMFGLWLDKIKERLREGDPSAEVYSDLTSYSLEELTDVIKNGKYGIKKKHKTLKLWKGEEVVTVGNVGQSILTARVKSKRWGGRNNVASRWLVEINFDEYGTGYSYIKCQSDEHFWDGVKGADVFCDHMGALLTCLKEVYNNQDAYKGAIRVGEHVKEPYLPFLINPMLEAELIVKRYVLGQNYYDIDKWLLDKKEIYDQSYLDKIETGKVLYDAVHSRLTKAAKPTDSINKGDILAPCKVASVMEKCIYKSGFRRVGLNAVEFKGTEWETLCANYEKGNKTLRLLMSEQLPPLLVYRESNPADKTDIFYKPNTEHPFSMLYQEQRTVDDRTRKATKTKILIPHSPRITPELIEIIPTKKPIIGNFKKKYAELIRRHYEGNKEELLEHLGLQFS
ncbi:MAG: hypothetical protein NT129_05770 [Candidatus Aenigmarchaeota archaeon]|nr:hypothetical protein [Candidatus Aenigmarchaeota archaeon]